MSDESNIRAGSVVLGRFELVDRIARGGFATVWKARDRVLGKDVALKVLRPAIAADPAQIEEMKRETLRSRELSHPHIVHTYDFVQDGDTIAISMEYIEGETLSALIAKRPNRCFDPPDLSQWMADVCDALDYAHSERGSKKPLIHHDIKPGNIMVDRWGVAKVLDFGISKTISETRYQLTGQFVVAGTIPYMSPQQIRGQRPQPSDDIYAFGATVYALLTSKPPFYRGSPEHQIPSEIPPSMTERRAELEIEGGPIAPEWEETVAACLAKKAEDRPASITETAVRLGIREPSSRRAGQKPARAQPEARPEPMQTIQFPEAPRRSWKTPVIVASAVALVGLAGFVVWKQSADSAKQDAVASNSPAATNSGDAANPGGAASPPVATTPSVPGSEGHEESTVDPSAGAVAPPAVPDPRTSATSTTAEAGTPPRNHLGVPQPPKDTAEEARRAARIVELRTAVTREITAARWSQAASAVNELRELDPSLPELSGWERRIRDGRERDDRIESLSTAIPTAIHSGDWQRADALLKELVTVAPTHPDREKWARTVSDQLSLRDLVDRYRAAQEALDVNAYGALWVRAPSDLLQKMQRAYGDMRSQQIDVEILDASVTGDAAVVRLHEKRTFDLRVGGKKSAENDAVLNLQRTAQGWKIASRST